MNKATTDRSFYLPLTFALGLGSCIAFVACSRGSDDEPQETESGSEGETESDPSQNSTTSDSQGETSTSSTSTSTSTKSSDSDSTTSGTGTQDPGPKLGACDRKLMPTTTVKDRISESTMWSGVVRIEGAIEVSSGATLTIAPGTTVLAAQGAMLEISNFSNKSQIIAQGTQTEPIHFCGVMDSKGSWKGIEIGDDAGLQTAFKYVGIANAGEAERGALNLGAPVVLDHVEISGSAGYGLVADDFAAQSTDLRIEGSAAGVRLTKPGAVHRFPENCVMKGNTVNVAEIGFERIEGTATFRKLAVPYRQVKTLRVEDGAQMRLEAGVVYEVAPNAEINVAAFSGDLSLIAAGTMAEPVEFRLQEGASGTWGGLEFGGTESSRSSLTHVMIRGAGNENRPALDLESPVKLDTVTVQGGQNGVKIGDFGVGEGSKMLSIKEVKGRTLEIEPDVWVSLPKGGVFEGNEQNLIWVNNGTIKRSGTIAKMALPYHVDGRIELGRTTELVIEAGTSFEMGQRASLDFNGLAESGSVVAKGTMADHIKIYGAERTKGYWNFVALGSDLGASTVFEYVDFSDGGNGFETGMLELGRAFPISNCTFTNSAGYGIRRKRDDNTDYAASNTFQGNDKGQVGFQ